MVDADKFLREQLAQWPKAQANYDALASVKQKQAGWARVQFNPARIASTGAKVDAAAIKERPCFLCEKNRPAEQYGIGWGRYTVLVNPFPIFPRHLTIPATDHTPQRIAGRMADMCRLADELPTYALFYNGPKCGASAPDHMHFQAGNADFLPLLAYADSLALSGEGAWVPTGLSAGMPGFVVIKAATIEAAEREFASVYDSFEADDESGEPMMNVLCQKLPTGDWRIIVIPRKRHRPTFYGPGEGQMLLSPASVDLAGVFITPMQKDFEAIDEQVLAKAVAELCYSPEEIKSRLKKSTR